MNLDLSGTGSIECFLYMQARRCGVMSAMQRRRKVPLRLRAVLDRGALPRAHRNGAGRSRTANLACTRQPVTYDKAALENEKVIYRTRVTCIYIHWNAASQSGECVVTNVRLVLKWDDGTSNEYPLTRIASVQAVPDIRFTSRLRKDVPGIPVHLTEQE